MKSKLLQITVLMTLLITLSACTTSDSETSEPESDLSSATVEKTGDSEGKFADEPKPEKRSYDLIEEALAEKNGLNVRDFTLGINRLTLTHFRGIVSGKEGVVLAAKQDGEWKIVFDGAYNVTKSYTCDSVAEYDFPEDMIEDCVAS